jgi:hypothetical protein
MMGGKKIASLQVLFIVTLRNYKKSLWAGRIKGWNAEPDPSLRLDCHDGR